jgi:uncharacterized protein YqgV (UPF0045/DUF77 family)
VSLVPPLARCARLAEASRLPHRVTDEAIVIQGSIPELFALAERMHEEVRSDEGIPGVITTMRIEDDKAAVGLTLEEHELAATA